MTGVASGPAEVDAVRRWAGMPSATPQSAGTPYFFKETGGRRAPLNSADSELMLRELRGGGHFLLQIDQKSGFTSVMLTKTNAAS